MIRLVALGFALALATSAQAMPVPSPHQPDGMITQRVGYELMVSAWPGPPFAMRAGVRDGMEAFVFGGSERQSAPDGHGLAVPCSRASRRLNMK